MFKENDKWHNRRTKITLNIFQIIPGDKGGDYRVCDYTFKYFNKGLRRT